VKTFVSEKRLFFLEKRSFFKNFQKFVLQKLLSLVTHSILIRPYLSLRFQILATTLYHYKASGKKLASRLKAIYNKS